MSNTILAEHLIEAGRRRLRREVDRFSRTGDEAVQARELLEHAAGGDVYDDDQIGPTTVRKYQTFLERRAQGEPIGYIRGFEEFRGFRLSVGPGAFIPRDTTQFLAEQAIRRLRRRRSPVAVDIATGVGAVALAVARDVRHATVFGTDISPTALKLARANARRYRLRNARFVMGSGFEPLPSKYRGALDAITSHPPYVPTHEIPELPLELQNYEPVESLTDSSEDGLGFIRMLVNEGREWLAPGGWMLLEVGPDVARPVRSLLTKAGYEAVKSTRGTSPYSRVVVAKR